MYYKLYRVVLFKNKKPFKIFKSFRLFAEWVQAETDNGNVKQSEYDTVYTVASFEFLEFIWLKLKIIFYVYR